jgi:hypothetical protein
LEGVLKTEWDQAPPEGRDLTTKTQRHKEDRENPEFRVQNPESRVEEGNTDRS